jgi:hypothetical protein
MSISRGHSNTAIAVSTAFMRGVVQPGTEALRPRPRDVTTEWLAVADRVAQHVDLDSTAHAQGAMVRRRGVPSATNLLCLAFLYGPGRMPLRLIVERAASLGIANVSEPALLRRLLNASPWLEHLADTLIIDRLDEIAEADHPTRPSRLGTFTPRPIETAMSQPLHERRTRQIDAAKTFFLDFHPWPDSLYSDSQIHWLMCVRWMFVTATIKDGPITRGDTDLKPTSALERSRLMAHLVNALVAPED